MLGFGLNLDHIWNFVKCSLLPFFYLVWPAIKQKKCADPEKEVNKHFWPNVYPNLGFGDVFQENGFHHYFYKYNKLTECTIFKWLMKRWGNNLIIASK